MRFRYAEVVTNILNLAKGSYVGEWLESGQSLFPSKSKGMFGPRKCGGGGREGGGKGKGNCRKRERSVLVWAGIELIFFLVAN